MIDWWVHQKKHAVLNERKARNKRVTKAARVKLALGLLDWFEENHKKFKALGIYPKDRIQEVLDQALAIEDKRKLEGLSIQLARRRLRHVENS